MRPIIIALCLNEVYLFHDEAEDKLCIPKTLHVPYLVQTRNLIVQFNHHKNFEFWLPQSRGLQGLLLLTMEVAGSSGVLSSAGVP